jgi:cyanate permease
LEDALVYGIKGVVLKCLAVLQLIMHGLGISIVQVLFSGIVASQFKKSSAFVQASFSVHIDLSLLF